MSEQTHGAPVTKDPKDIDAPNELNKESPENIDAPDTLTTVPAEGLKPLEDLNGGD